MESFFYIVDIAVEVFYDSHEDSDHRYPYEESYESEEVLSEEEYHERYKNREVNISRYNLRIEVVCLYGMYEHHHNDTCDHNWPTTESISDDDDGKTGYKSPKHRNKSKYKYYESNRHNIGKWCTMKYKSNQE